jgi:multidrug resistance efflux pump
MRSALRSIQHRSQRIADGVFDALGMRPLGILVFACSAALLVHLTSLSAGSIRADAVATAGLIDHPSKVASYVDHVFVKPGDHVEIGAPMVQLSSYFVDQRIARFDTEIEQIINESKLAQAQLMVKEQRWLTPEMRALPTRPSLESPTEALYAKQLEVMQTRRRLLQVDRESLVIKASFAGVVDSVSWVGAAVAQGASVATLRPEFADEIIAYVKPMSDPDIIVEGARAYIVQPTSAACRAAGHVMRRGASVQQAPTQLNSFFRFPVHGTPIHVSIPPECALGIGQTLSVEFERKVS